MPATGKDSFHTGLEWPRASEKRTRFRYTPANVQRKLDGQIEGGSQLT